MTTADEKHQMLLDRLDAIEKKKGSERAWDIATKFAVPAILGLSIWGVGLEIRMSNVELRISNLEKWKVEGVPPKWLRDKVQEIEGTLREIRTRLRALENNK